MSKEIKIDMTKYCHNCLVVGGYWNDCKPEDCICSCHAKLGVSKKAYKGNPNVTLNEHKES